MADRFRLQIMCEIQRTDEHGTFSGDRLAVRDEIHIQAENFFEIAQVLGQFHELAEAIRKSHVHG